MDQIVDEIAVRQLYKQRVQFLFCPEQLSHHKTTLDSSRTAGSDLKNLMH